MINLRFVLLVCFALVVGAFYTFSASSQSDSGTPKPGGSEDQERIPDWENLVTETYVLGGYASKLSVVPGESLDFHISTNVGGPFSLAVYREGATRQLVTTIDGVTAGTADCTGLYATGCGWPAALSFTVPIDWPTGVYSVDIPIAGGGTRYIIFWVRESTPGADGRILFLSSVNTYNAYNNYGGKSLYDFNSTNNVRSPEVSFNRPFQDLGLGQFRRWDGKFVTWAEAHGYPVAYAATYDLHYHPTLLDAYEVVVISGHSEYWTWDMRQRMKQYISNGGRLVNLSGNTMWRQIRYIDDGRTMVGYIPAALDPVQSQTQTSGPNWDHPIYDVSFHITGTHWPFGGYKPTYDADNGGYWIQNANHWVFAGTGLAENAVLGRTATPDATAIHDHEADGMPFNCAPDGSTVLGPVGNSGTPPTFTVLGLAPLYYPPKDMDNFAVMGIYTVEGGGAAFSANTTGWVRALNDPAVSRVTSNVIDKFLEAEVPAEPVKADTDYLFYDRFNCDNMGQDRFSSTGWLATMHRFNYFRTTLTAANALSDACGIEGSGLRLALGNTRNGMSYQSMLKPNFGAVNQVANSMYLNLAGTALAEGAHFDLVSYYHDSRLSAPSVAAALQLGKQGGRFVMRLQPTGSDLTWHEVPSSGFFKISTWWDKPNNQIALWVNDTIYLETADLSVLPDFNRADLGMANAVGSNSGALCTDELIFDDQPLSSGLPSSAPTFKDDILALNFGPASDQIWFSTGGANPPYFTKDSGFDESGTYEQMIAGDYNADGLTDILAFNSGAGDDALWYSTGNAAFPFFSKNMDFTEDGTYDEMIPGDYNGDGKTDILAFNNGLGDDVLWYATGNASLPFFIRKWGFSEDGTYDEMISGDFNHDGLTDILALNYGAGPDALWHATGSASPPFFSKNWGFNEDGTYDQMITGDFNGDGLTDILALNYGLGTDALWYATGRAGAPFFTKNYGFREDDTYDEIITGDYNHDGLTDVLALNYGLGTDALWYATGSASPPFFVKNYGFREDGTYEEMITGDYNHDGLTDILALNYGLGTDALWHATGSANPPYFSKNYGFREDGAYDLLIAGDFNQDVTAKIPFGD